jgi:hypothetical protein
MAWTKSRYDIAEPELQTAARPLLQSLLRPVDELLASGGDARLTLSLHSRENSYGCTPFPRPALIDFASSTASSISVQAYERVKQAKSELVERCLRDGAEEACEAAMASARQSLLATLKLEDSATQVIFSPSGTDGQLHALFLAKSLFHGPLSVIVSGSDQTGSGTAQTCKGQHFSQTTARGCEVEKGGTISGLGEGLESIDIAFSKPCGEFRNLSEMDEATLCAVEAAVSRDRNVLLQAMDASKFGWRAPSDGCLDAIAKRWPGRVRIVVDACQLRLSRKRLKTLLAKGYCVLVTGSKFFTGPAFSGALLVPAQLSREIAVIRRPPKSLSGYTSFHDWPHQWSSLRAHLPAELNLGQWLRWEAALEEMRLYYAAPKSFRDGLTKSFAQALASLVEASPRLGFLPEGPDQASTIFAVTLGDDKALLPPDAVAKIYRGLKRDLSGLAGFGKMDFATRLCQLGQPVSLPARNSAALRISLSARTIRRCWSGGEPHRRVAQLFDDLSVAIGKLDCLAGRVADLGEMQ